MIRKKKPARQAFAALFAEMGAPRLTASAALTLHQLPRPSRARKLYFIDPFHGYACNRCGCRFPESRSPQRRSPSDTRRLSKLLREKQFAAHTCSAG